MTVPSANRGEWSELYAIGYLITRGGGHAADEFTKLDKSIFYKVLKIVDNPSGGSETIYKLHDEDVEILQNGVAVVRVTKDQIAPKLNVFFQELLKQTESAAFELATGQELMRLIRKDKLSASSALSADLHLILEDVETKTETPKKGFSIKSEIGSPATIFNASHSTGLTYKILGKGTPQTFQKVSAVKTNVKDLVSKGYSLEFSKYDNPIFEKSLRNIDSNLPDYLANLLLAFTHSKTTNLRRICEIAFPENDASSEMKIQKIKKFLSAASMGLKAATEWTGYPEDFGGMLLVKRDGDVLFYYLYNMKKFEEYLFNNLRFETPHASKHGFGQVYTEGSDNFFKLNLQIRFK
jgi:type II restriction enzyme